MCLDTISRPLVVIFWLLSAVLLGLGAAFVITPGGPPADLWDGVNCTAVNGTGPAPLADCNTPVVPWTPSCTLAFQCVQSVRVVFPPGVFGARRQSQSARALSNGRLQTTYHAGPVPAGFAPMPKNNSVQTLFSRGWCPNVTRGYGRRLDVDENAQIETDERNRPPDCACAYELPVVAGQSMPCVLVDPTTVKVYPKGQTTRHTVGENQTLVMTGPYVDDYNEVRPRRMWWGPEKLEEEVYPNYDTHHLGFLFCLIFGSVGFSWFGLLLVFLACDSPSGKAVEYTIEPKEGKRIPGKHYDNLPFATLADYVEGRSQASLQVGDEVCFPAGTCVIAGMEEVGWRIVYEWWCVCGVRGDGWCSCHEPKKKRRRRGNGGDGGVATNGVELENPCYHGTRKSKSTTK